MSLDTESKKWLLNLLGDNVKFDELMAGHTSLRVGGPADAFVAPEKLKDLAEIIAMARQNKIEHIIIGDGTNLLVKDRGIRGIVIVLTKMLSSISMEKHEKNKVIVTAAAGARLNSVCLFALKNGLKGMSFGLGIPGTVGGGIIMNSGTAYGSMESVIDSVSLLDQGGRTKSIKKDQLNFSYKKLLIKNGKSKAYIKEPVITDAAFCLQSADPDKLKNEIKAILEAREKSQPLNVSSAGCFFKNPASGKSAGELIELADLKGKKRGDAQVSLKHANFIINLNKASAADILGLMEFVQETILKEFSVILEPEVKIVGE